MEKESVTKTAAAIYKVTVRERAAALDRVLSAARDGDGYSSAALDFNARLVTRLRQIEAWPPR